MNSGCFSNRHAVAPSIPTYIKKLRDNGINTAMVGKFHHHVHVFEADFISNEKDIHDLGFDFVHQTSGKQGCGLIWCECHYARFLRELGLLDEYRTWMDFLKKKNGKTEHSIGTNLPNEEWKWDAELTQDAYIASKACEYIRQNPVDKPFYLHVGFVGPHNPFDAPKKYRDLYAQQKVPKHIAGNPVETQQWLAYVAGITEVDEMVGRVVRELELKGILDNTIIIYTSDHGDCAGERGLWGKINFYEGAVHVPFIVAGPNLKQGVKNTALAELIDIGSTVCDFMNCSKHHYDQGMSLKPLLSGDTETHRSDVFCEMGSDKMLFDGRYKLMYGDITKDTRQEFLVAPYHGPGFGRPINLPPDKISLYDLQNDPDELVNLAYDPAFKSLTEDMKERLLKRLILNMQAVIEDEESVL